MFSKRKLLSLVVVLAMLLVAVPMPASTSLAQETPSCGTDPVTLRAYFETGFDLPFKLSEEFTNQFPNVTWDISQDQFTNLIN